MPNKGKRVSFGLKEEGKPGRKKNKNKK